MATLGDMKARIADELSRADLTDQIDKAISTAISAYQIDRFSFSENRDTVFNTVAGQQTYGAADDPAIETMPKYDWMTIVIANSLRTIWRIHPEVLDYDSGNTNSSGQPYNYSYYGRKIRLYPTPNEVWEVRINGQAKISAPADDDEADNVWMNEAETMIRSRAKYEIAVHLLRDDALAVLMSPDKPAPGTKGGHETFKAWRRLKRYATRQTSTGRILGLV